jgi:2-dehydro-3-deoxygalactonokinase
MVRQFLSCDWGTSSFRLKLVENNPFRIVAEVQNSHGISATHSAWQQNGAGHDRFLFYASLIKASVSLLEAKVNLLLSGVPIVISGMASSSLGMVILPYKHIPFNTDGSDLELSWIKSSADFNHDVIILSGVCSDTDVMRGEETQLVGAAGLDPALEQLYIFPGTHSKHITVRNNRVVDFKTYMTGELFALLSKSSTLAEAVQGRHNFRDENSIQHFTQGVRDSKQSNLLHSLFTVRTRYLLQKYPGTINHSYLSGLLIGSEVSDLVNPTVKGITLVSSSMSDHYGIAMATLQVPVPVNILPDEDVTVRGQLAIVSRHAVTKKLFEAESV